MNNQQFSIDTLNLRLPASLAPRAQSIARQVGVELAVAWARAPLQHSARTVVLQVPTVRLHGGEADRVIAGRIARAIYRQAGGIGRQDRPVGGR